MEVVQGTKVDGVTRIRVLGERGAFLFCVPLGNIYMRPESKSAVKEMQRKVGEVVVDVQKYKRQGELTLLIVGDFDSKIWKASNPHVNIG